MNFPELLLPSLFYLAFGFWSCLPIKDGRPADWPKDFTPKLSDWLALATWKLVPSVQARIRSEIEAHYAESFSLHLAQGASASEAAAAALAALGDPQAAGRRFRHEHLLKSDAVQVGWCKKYSSGLLIMALGCLFPLLVTGAPTTTLGLVIGALECLLLATSCAALFLSQLASSPALLRHITLLYALFTLTLGSLLVLFSGFVDSPGSDGVIPYFLFLVAFCFLVINQSLRFFRFSQKLPSASETDFSVE